ncbi:hypothetical protein [Pseudomonas sp. XK-1]|uniref:hypothetical protein n=1 Tax=Pseudomonas sp. XK-1 TaxID=3136019 RepID=UPI00311A517A
MNKGVHPAKPAKFDDCDVLRKPTVNPGAVAFLASSGMRPSLVEGLHLALVFGCTRGRAGFREAQPSMYFVFKMEKKMFKKTLICSFFAVLAGCDNSSVEQGATELKTNGSTTAIYFPGGGVDFGKKPLFDNSKKDESGAHVGSITYSFDQSVEALSKETRAVMIAQGYSESKTKSDKCDPCMIYSKDGVDIAFAYNSVNREGADDGARLLIWWKGEK